MILVVGGNGRLGQAIVSELARNVMVLPRELYKDWSQQGASSKVSRYLESLQKKITAILIPAGLLDPRLNQSDLIQVNFNLPKNIIEGALRLGIKVVTFGSIMEELLQTKNSYVYSKVLLANYVNEAVSAGHPIAHIRLHTLYGVGEPSEFMFLGQILNSLRQDVFFDMTQGRQLREYHHVKDAAKAVLKILDGNSFGVINISHGKPLSLKEIAQNIFQTFGKTSLLRIGTLPEPHAENYSRIFDPPDLLRDIQFRDSMSGIIAYMQQLVFN